MDAIEEIDYHGYKIEVHDDPDPTNPFTDGGCEPPILVYLSDRGRGSVAEYGVDDGLPLLDYATVRKHWPEMLNAMDYSADWLGLMAFARDYFVVSDILLDDIRDQYGEYVSELPPEERFKAVAEAYGWLGVAAEVHQIHGHSQGERGYVLAAATPEWVKLTGAPEETHRDQLKGAITLYEDWVFGSVYGFVAENPDGEEVDACWGFYGMDHEASGLLEHAQNAIDCDIPTREKRMAFEAVAREVVLKTAHSFQALHVPAYAEVEPDKQAGGSWVTARVLVPTVPG